MSLSFGDGMATLKAGRVVAGGMELRAGEYEVAFAEALGDETVPMAPASPTADPLSGRLELSERISQPRRRPRCADECLPADQR